MSPAAPALLLMTQATRAPNNSCQRSFCAAFVMASMFEPAPEIKITMFLATFPISLCSFLTTAFACNLLVYDHQNPDPD